MSKDKDTEKLARQRRSSEPARPLREPVDERPRKRRKTESDISATPLKPEEIAAMVKAEESIGAAEKTETAEILGKVKKSDAPTATDPQGKPHAEHTASFTLGGPWDMDELLLWAQQMKDRFPILAKAFKHRSEQTAKLRGEVEEKAGNEHEHKEAPEPKPGDKRKLEEGEEKEDALERKKAKSEKGEQDKEDKEVKDQEAKDQKEPGQDFTPQ